MSVVKSNRGESDMEFLYNARQLQIYTIKKCVNFPKRYTFYLNQPLSNIATRIHENVKCANSIYPLNQHEVQIRRDYLLRALAELNNMVSQIEVANELLGLELNVLELWMEMIDREIKLIKALLKKDRERYKSISS